MDSEIIEKVYSDIFLKLKHRNIDLFLCGGASTKDHTSFRDKLKDRLLKYEELSIFYPEDLFMELVEKRKYDLFTLEQFLAENSDSIILVVESIGSSAELGVFISKDEILHKLAVLIQTKYKNNKSFIMQGPIRYIEKNEKKKVLYFNNDIRKLEETVTDYLSNVFSFFGDQKYYRIEKMPFKNLSMITGQKYFILLLLFFYSKINVKDLVDAVKNMYFFENPSGNQFDVLYTSALKRLYKEGLLVKEPGNNSDYYKLTKKGYISVKGLLQDVRIDNHDKIINGIRLHIIRNQ